MKKITLIFVLLSVLVSLEINAQSYEENFDNYNAGDDPTGWTKYQTETDDPGFIVTDGQSSSAPNSLYHNDDNITNESTSWIVAPPHTIAGNDILSFDYYQNWTASYYNYSGVWYSTTGSDPIANPGDWTQIAEFNDTDQPYSEDTWTQFSYTFNENAGTTVYIAFKYTGDFAHEFYIDNFKIDVTSPIFDLSVTEDCANSQFTVDVNVSDFSGGSSVTITDDQGSAPQQLNAPGTATFGPYPAGLSVLFTVTNDLNVSGTAVGVGYCPPECAENPIPANNATAVAIESGRKISLSWEASTSGSIPDKYKIEYGTSSGSYYTPIYTNNNSIELLGFTENTIYYWKVTPISGNMEATGCPEWSFTTDAFPTISNDNCENAEIFTLNEDSCINSINVDLSFATFSTEPDPSCGGYNSANGTTGDLWYAINIPVNTTEINFNINNLQSSTAISSALYSGSCGNLTEISCNDVTNGSGWPWNISGLTSGETYYLRIWDYYNNNYATFELCGYYNTASISDNKIKNFKFYPNPVDNTLNMTAQNNIEKISITNVSGQEVIKLNPDKTQTQVDLSRLPNGIYFVKAQVNGEVTAFKIVKK